MQLNAPAKKRKTDLADYAHNPGADVKMTHIYTMATWALAHLSAPLQRVAAKCVH